MMINKTWAMVGAGAFVLVVGVAAIALASSWGGSKRPAATQSATSSNALRFASFDADKNGSITRSEIDAGITTQFGAADANGDGKLDAAEILRYNDKRKADRRARYEAWKVKAAALGRDPGRPPSDRDTVDTLRIADWNLDGVVTPDEFGGKTRALAMRADRNGDGIISAEELTRRTGRGTKDTAKRN